jgi:hypothetical protein
MKISADTEVPFPRDLVFVTYRDKLSALVPYMPNVRSIKVKGRRAEGNRVFCENEWHGGGDIPAVARAFLSEQMLIWTEYNTWDNAEFSLEWRIQTHAFTEAVHCSGKNYFLEKGKSTLIRTQGQLLINSQKIKGVPSFMVKQVAQIVEDFLGQKIKPNLLQMGEGVGRYLEQQSGNESSSLLDLS